MNSSVQSMLIALVVLAAIAVLRLVRQRRLRGFYVLLWLGACLAITPLALTPDRVDELVTDLGVSYPPAAYLLAAVAFLLAVVVHFSLELSRLDERTRTLAEELALLRGDVENGPGEPLGRVSDRSSG